MSAVMDERLLGPRQTMCRKTFENEQIMPSHMKGNATKEPKSTPLWMDPRCVTFAAAAES